MSFIYQKNHVERVDNVGGKGHQLQLLFSWEMNVPDFFIIGTDTHEYYLKHNDFPEIVYSQVNDFFSLYPYVSFRSSMVGEDQKDASFAGIFETILNVNKENWKASLHKVYQSLYDKRVESYLKEKQNTVLKMAVVVQRMVYSEKSGVLFTRSPMTPTSLVVIDAGLGLGEGVVSGTIDTDHYRMDRLGNMNSTGEKKVLSKKERLKLLESALYIEKKFSLPADIEWGIVKDDIYFFQVRPITQNFLPLEFFVDTNLSESYPGVVSPFTASFVQKAYENVFYESAVILGGTGQKLERLHSHYKKLIAYVDGHLYYNLEHYYAVLRALPGGEKNIQGWHKMIGGNHSLQGIPFHNTSPTIVETVQTLWRLLNIAFKHEKVFQEVTSKFELLKKRIEDETNKKKNPREIILFLNELIESPFGFGWTVVNDVYVMIGLSLFTSLCKRKGISEEKMMSYLETNEGVESVLPLTKLKEIVPLLSLGFLDAFSKENLQTGIKPYEKIFHSLSSQGYENEVLLLKNFLAEFGERSFEELKLESLPLAHSPHDLYALLRWYKTPMTKKDSVVNSNAELSGLIGIVHRFLLKAISTREKTRLFRGKFYNLIRELVLRLEEKLKGESSEWKEFESKDFFSLTAQEWLHLPQEEARQTIQKRRSWKNLEKNYPEILCWVANEEITSFDSPTSDTTSELKGQGVSEGEIEGVVLVLERPTDAFQLNLEDVILVTKNTDPAWVYVMSQSKGLISEKGSLLSHTAIIGRELRIPTIVGVRAGTKFLKTGERIRMNGKTGEIERL